MAEHLLEVENLKMYFKKVNGVFRRKTSYVKAVDNISFTIDKKETFGLVGESGCGKTTTGRALIRLYEPTGGTIRYDGEDITKLSAKEFMPYRKKMQMIFQDPYSSLNSRMSVEELIAAPLLVNDICPRSEVSARVAQLMDTVGLARRMAASYPHELDGGRRQRIGVARALAVEPEFIVCDEPVSALDVSIQAQILNLLMDIQEERHIAYMFITHDLGVVANVADRVAVLYGGQVVELGTCEEVFYDPRHPYTWALLSSLPQLAQRNTKLYSITGTPPSLYNKIVGDAFAPRNPYCLEIDTLREPPMFQVSETHFAKTWLLDPRAPKVEKPETIQNIHEKLVEAFNI